MNTYIVKSGQNIFDVALTLYGSIEGIFDLLISNADRGGQVPLSYDSSLSAGEVLNYNPDFLINNSIKTYFENNSIKVANGEHIYSYTNPKGQILQYVNDYNQKVISQACELYPNVWDVDNDRLFSNYNRGNANSFFNYISNNYWGCGYSNVEYATNQYLLGADTERATSGENDNFTSGLHKTKMLIIQSGQLTSFSGKLQRHTLLGIDWGDNTSFEIYINDKEVNNTYEHYYEDDGQHKILLYGNFVFEDLDFSNVNGVYYPMSVIDVKNSFKSKFKNDNIINQLINVNSNE